MSLLLALCLGRDDDKGDGLGWVYLMRLLLGHNVHSVRQMNACVRVDEGRERMKQQGSRVVGLVVR